jgi:hypothetical protein
MQLLGLVFRTSEIEVAFKPGFWSVVNIFAPQGLQGSSNTPYIGTG